MPGIWLPGDGRSPAETFASMPRGHRYFYCAVIMNFVLFVAGTLVLGGDALNGHIAAGHYFLGSHHRYTEVTRAIYWYSAVHTVSVMLTMPIALILGLSARA